MATAALRRVEGAAPSARRRSLISVPPLLALLFLATIVFSHLVCAEPVPDLATVPVPDAALAAASSPLSAAAQAMAAAAERQTELREVSLVTAMQSAAASTAMRDDDADHQPPAPPSPSLEAPSPAFASSTASRHTADADELAASVNDAVPSEWPHSTSATTVDAVPQSCSPQSLSHPSPFRADDSCYTAASPTPTSALPPTDAVTANASASSNLSLSAAVLDAFVPSNTTDTSSTSTAQPLASERDNTSASSERVVEQSQKKNPIAELKENVLKHIEEKKKEKEKEKKKEQQLEVDNSNSSSSNNTQAPVAVGSVLPSPALSASSSASPAATVAVPPPAVSPSANTPSATVTLAAAAAAPAASSPTSLIYPSPPPSSISDRFNYAAYDSGAKLLLSSPGMKKASAILSSDDDSYMMTPCSSAAKYVIVQLKEDIQLDMIELINREHYSSSIQQFSLYGSNVYPTEEWVALGRFWADETQQAQYWRLDAGDYAVRYVKLIWETWWKDEYYCTLTQLGVYGRSVLEAFREDLDDSAEVLREVEQVLIEQNLAMEADMERKEVREDGSETTKDEGQAGGGSDAAIALTETAIELSATPPSSASSAYLWDVVAFWTHQSSVDPVISQLMGVDQPPSIVVTAHSQSTASHGRLSISSPLSSSTDADKLFAQPICPSFNVSQPVTLLFPHPHASPAARTVSSSSSVADSSDTITVTAESDSDDSEHESDSESTGESAAETAEEDAHATFDVPAQLADSDSSAQIQPSPVVVPDSSTAAAIPTTPAAAATPASLFSEFLYSQMARLSKQAGAQSQAEAEKIDPHYAALLAKYTGRDRQKTVQPTSIIAPASSSLPSAVPSTQATDDSAASTTLPASSASFPSSAVSDTVALVSAADANKGKSSSHQSIFRTLTNRLKEVELHQALSTHFVSVLSERFGAEIEQLQTTLAKLKHSNGLQPGSDSRPTMPLEDREALREEIKAEVRRELQDEMQRVLDMQQRTEQRLAEMSAANRSMHTLLHQELLALVLVLVSWTVLSSLLSPLSLRTVVWYVWRVVRVVAVWSARVTWRTVVWVWSQAVSGWPASSTAAAAGVPKPVHRRASSADSSRRSTVSTPVIAAETSSRQQSKAVEQPPTVKPQHPQRQPQRPNSSMRQSNGHAPHQPQPQLQQPQQTNIKHKPPFSSTAASPCTWRLDSSALPSTTKSSSVALSPLAGAVDGDDVDSMDGDDDSSFGSWQLEAIDSGSARPHLSPPADRAASPRRGSWSGQPAGLEQRKAAWIGMQQQRTGDSGRSSYTQPLPSRQTPSPLPPLRPTVTAPTLARLSAKHRSRTADAAQLPSFIRRAMSPPGAATASVPDSSSSSSSSVLIQPYVSHASINSFALLQSPDRRNRALLVK